jgi:hypothetical protein
VAYSTDGITCVRARPFVIDAGDSGPAAVPGAVEVTWESANEGRWHQAYVGGVLAATTAAPEDRHLVVVAPVAGNGPNPVLIEVIAVEAQDRSVDFGGELSASAIALGSRAHLAWQAGPYLDPGLDSFDIFADARTGTVDYTRPLNELPLAARPGGAAPWGFGCGGFGAGGYGTGTACYEWTSDPLAPGAWRFAVVASDAAGNRRETVTETDAQVASLPRPPENFRSTHYEPGARQATLAWDPSPDV